MNLDDKRIFLLIGKNLMRSNKPFINDRGCFKSNLYLKNLGASNNLFLYFSSLKLFITIRLSSSSLNAPKHRKTNLLLSIFNSFRALSISISVLYISS